MTKGVRTAFFDLHRSMVLKHLEWRGKSKKENDKAAEMARVYDVCQSILDSTRLKLEKGHPHTSETKHNLSRILSYLEPNTDQELANKLRENIINPLSFQFERTKEKGMSLKDNKIRDAFLNLYQDMFFSHLEWRERSWALSASRRENEEAAEIARVYDACRILLDQIRLKFEKGEPYRSFQQNLDTMLEFVKLYQLRRYEYQGFIRLIDALKEEESDE